MFLAAPSRHVHASKPQSLTASEPQQPPAANATESLAQQQQQQRRRKLAAAKRDAERIAAVEEALRARAATRLSEWAAEAKRRARTLDERYRVWHLVDEFGTEALNLGVYVELRDLCEEAIAMAAKREGADLFTLAQAATRSL